MVRLSPLKLRPFSWLTFRCWERCLKSLSKSRQLVMDRVSKGVFRHLGRHRAVTCGGWTWWAEAGEDDAGLQVKRPMSPKPTVFRMMIKPRMLHSEK